MAVAVCNKPCRQRAEHRHGIVTTSGGMAAALQISYAVEERMKRLVIGALLFLSVGVTASAQDWAKAALEKSPRHREWVNVKNGNRTVSAFVVYPEVKTKAAAVVVIHEIYGMSDWVQLLADEVAEAGSIAIAPDLLSGLGPNGGGTSSFADSNAIGKAIR